MLMGVGQIEELIERMESTQDDLDKAVYEYFEIEENRQAPIEIDNVKLKTSDKSLKHFLL